MKRYILTGTPGCGKTSLIRNLEFYGHFVIEEAATAIIALKQVEGIKEPWKDFKFVEEIVLLQKQRQIQVDTCTALVQFYDRSPICTLALANYLGVEPSPSVLREIQRIKEEKIYQDKVFFIENLGFCQRTEARKINFEESLVFEKIHINVYEEFGYECVKIPAGNLADRTKAILNAIKL